MSAPLIEEKKAQYIDLSFLAALTRRAINSILDSKLPDDQGRQALPKAQQFLRDIASGAAFVATGDHPQGFDAVRAVDALDFAMGPIENLQQLLIHKDIAAYFGEVAEAVAQIEDPIHQITGDERVRLEFAANFFTALYESLSWLLDHPGEKELSFDGRRFERAA